MKILFYCIKIILSKSVSLNAILRSVHNNVAIFSAAKKNNCLTVILNDGPVGMTAPMMVRLTQLNENQLLNQLFTVNKNNLNKTVSFKDLTNYTIVVESGMSTLKAIQYNERVKNELYIEKSGGYILLKNDRGKCLTVEKSQEFEEESRLRFKDCTNEITQKFYFKPQVFIECKIGLDTCPKNYLGYLKREYDADHSIDELLYK